MQGSFYKKKISQFSTNSIMLIKRWQMANGNHEISDWHLHLQILPKYSLVLNSPPMIFLIEHKIYSAFAHINYKLQIQSTSYQEHNAYILDI